MRLPLVFNGQTFTVRPRTALIMRQLIEQSEEIEQVPFGSWQAHFAGRRVQTLLTRSYRAQAVDTDQADER